MPLALLEFLTTASDELKKGVMDWLEHTTDDKVLVELWEAVDPTA